MKNMKNNLTKFFSKIPKILTIIIFIALLIMPFKVLAISLDEQGSVDIKQEENLRISKNNPTNISRDNVELYLFLGNSKTHYNNFPFMFQSFMNDLGKSVIVREATRAGHSLSDLFNNEIIKNELNNEYDYVVLQPKLLSPDSGEKEAALSIVDALKRKNPNIKVIINGIWKSGDQYKLNKTAQKIMNNRFRELKDAITSQCGVETKISYWGQAAIRAFNKNSISESQLFVDDIHPTVLNTYLGVASLYSTIYGTEANSNYNGRVDNRDFESVGEYSLTSWNYQIDRNRWPNDTTGTDQTQLMQRIAYETYVAENENPEEEEREDEGIEDGGEQTDLTSLANRLSQSTSSEQTNLDGTGLTSEQLTNILNRINQAIEEYQSNINDIVFSSHEADNNSGGLTDLVNRINQATSAYQAELDNIRNLSNQLDLVSLMDRINQATSAYQSELDNILQSSLHGADAENRGTSSGQDGEYSSDQSDSSNVPDGIDRIGEETEEHQIEIVSAFDDPMKLSVDNSPRISIKNDENSGVSRRNQHGERCVFEQRKYDL